MDNVQLSMMDLAHRDWISEIESLCQKMIRIHELPLGSLYLARNMGREGMGADKREEVISYSICIYEPEYPEVKGVEKDPTRNTVIMNIKEVPLKKSDDRLEILVRDNVIDFLGGIPNMKDADIVPKTYWRKYHLNKGDINSSLDGWLDYIETLIEYSLRTYESKATRFGCCSRFSDCSDAKKCVHENKLYACACYYKSNLDAGKIFYGKNKNV